MIQTNESSIAKWITDGLDSTRYSVLRDVPNTTGHGVERRCDLIVVDTWPSGHGLHGYEIKVSRSDWLNELRNPVKSDAFSSLMDEWSLAVPDPKIIRPGELPESWGLVVASGPGKTRTLKKPKHRSPRLSKLPYRFVLALVRRASARAIELERGVQERVREGVRTELEESLKVTRVSAVKELTRLRESVCLFEKKSGLKINDYNGEILGDAVALASSMNPDCYRGIPRKLEHAVRRMREEADAIEKESVDLRRLLKSKSR